jgi:oligoribonuclease (3'-5' exoribonuclease)
MPREPCGRVRSGSGSLPWRSCAADVVAGGTQMTGLDPDREEIIEIFCIITNGALEVMDEEGWGTVVHQTQERMDQMDEWCTKTHAKSGLTAAVLASIVTPEQAADGLLEYIKRYVPEKGAVLAGNSVHADRAFLRKEPYRKVVRHLHHRILDVSTIKEATRRWCPKEVINKAPSKRTLHQAKEDILESIAEARYYKEAVFQKGRD